MEKMEYIPTDGEQENRSIEALTKRIESVIHAWVSVYYKEGGRDTKDPEIEF